jgi:uncharacterized protein YggU (UPF0235/DUF167 family)
MKIFIKAKPGAKVESVRKVEGLLTGPAQFVVSVKEPPAGGKANRAIERALAEYFHVPPSRVRIVSGHASREKVVEVEALE